MKTPSYIFKTDEEIEKIAAFVREELGYTSVEPIDPIDALRRWQKINPKIDVRIVPQSFLGNNFATASWDERLIQVSKPVWQAALRSDRRHRFTIAEEIGHMALKQPGQLNRSIGEEARTRVRPEIRRLETEAGKFASFFLVPSLAAVGMTNKEIQFRFGVSMEAATYVVERLKSEHRRKHNISRPLPPKSAATILARLEQGEKYQKIDQMQLRAQVEGFESSHCNECGNYRVRKIGTFTRCEECGDTSDSE